MRRKRRKSYSSAGNELLSALYDRSRSCRRARLPIEAGSALTWPLLERARAPTRHASGSDEQSHVTPCLHDKRENQSGVLSCESTSFDSDHPSNLFDELVYQEQIETDVLTQFMEFDHDPAAPPVSAKRLDKAATSPG